MATIDCSAIATCINDTVTELCELDAECQKIDVITEEETQKWSDYRNSLVAKLREYRELYSQFCSNNASEESPFEFVQCGTVSDCYPRLGGKPCK